MKRCCQNGSKADEMKENEIIKDCYLTVFFLFSIFSTSSARQRFLKLDFAVHPKIVFARGIGVGCSDIAFSAVYKFINQLSHLLFQMLVSLQNRT
jgi:hypothetical protein